MNTTYGPRLTVTCGVVHNNDYCVPVISNNDTNTCSSINQTLGATMNDTTAIG